MATAYVSKEQTTDSTYEHSVSAVSQVNYDQWIDNALIVRGKGDLLRSEREFTIFCNKLRLLGLDLVEE